MVYENGMDTDAYSRNLGNNISRLKSMFQANNDMDNKENRGRSRSSTRETTSHQVATATGHGYRMNEHSPDTKRKRPDTLETNKNHGNVHKSRSISADRDLGHTVSVNPAAMDPQKLYETTNHVQRFQYTRAIFAKMEAENKDKNRQYSRSVSPGVGGRGRGFSPSPVQSPGSQDSSPGGYRGYKSRSASEPNRAHIDSALSGERRPGVVSHYGPQKPRRTSLDNMSPEGYDGENKYGHMGSSRNNSQRESLKSRSESDIFAENHLNRGEGDEGDKEVVDENQPSPQMLIQQFESKKSPTQQSSYSWHSSTTSSNTKPSTGLQKQELTGASDTGSFPDAGNSQTVTTTDKTSNTTSSLYKPLSNSGSSSSSTSQYKTSYSSSAYGRDSNIGLGKGSSSTKTGITAVAKKNSGNRSDYINKFTPDTDEDDDAINRLDALSSWRLRRQKEKEDKAVMETSTSSVTSTSSMHSNSGAVLLPKRRPRDEKRLSKEDIEASLKEADSYWQQVNDGSSTMSPSRHMTDSMNSSGSGEEMARSEINHEFTIESPASPGGESSDFSPSNNTASSWAAKYSISSNHSYSNSSNKSSISDAGELTSPTFLPRTDTLEKALSDVEKKSSVSSDSGKPPLPPYPSSSVFLKDSTESPMLNNSKPQQSTSLHNGHLSEIDTYTPANAGEINLISGSQQSTVAPPSLPTKAPPYTPKPSFFSSRGEDKMAEDYRGDEFSENMKVEEEREEDPEINLDEGADYVEFDRPVKKPPPFPEPSSPKYGAPKDDLLQDSQDDEDFRVDKREDGDGIEEPAQPEPQIPNVDDLYDGTDMVNQIWDQYFDYSQFQNPHMEPVDGKIEVFEDGNFSYEIQGLPDKDPDDEIYTTAKKPSRIQFSASPIKVYSTYSVEEYDRKNEDVDPMAASAEYELEKRVERMDQFEVDLVKGSDGLGLSIIGMGVGADAGLEKLGIFIKTLTEGGAAQKDGRIQVNDQIIEVDGKSLVGVTQAYAASVLRNTSGNVKFLIGREKDPSKSEVARLIQQSLEQDRRRAEAKAQIDEDRRRQEEMFRREQSLTDEVQEDMTETNSESSLLRDPDFLPSRGESQAEYVPPPLPASPPPGDQPPSYRPLTDVASTDSRLTDLDSITSAGGIDKTVAEGTDLVLDEFEIPESASSSEPDTPDLDPHTLYIKLKEAQYKNAVAEAEMAKLKAKMIMLEHSDSQRQQYERRCEEMSQRLRDTEKTIQNLQTEMERYQMSDDLPGAKYTQALDMLEGSQGEYIQLEQEMNSQYGTLEKKYSKAKKLIKEYQIREKEIMQERESVYQQQTEKEQQYNQIVRTLKDRIFSLERSLKVSGNQNSPHRDPTADIVIPSPTIVNKKQFKPMEIDNISLISELDIEQNNSSPEKSPTKKEPSPEPVQKRIVVNSANKNTFANAVPETELLDTSASKTKGQLGSAGSLSQRRPPTRRSSSGTLSSQENEEEEDEPFLQHGRDDASDTSSVTSQASGSYEPNKVEITGPGSKTSDLIPTSVDEEDTGGVTLISAKNKPGGLTRLFSPSSKSTSASSVGGGGITLLSMKPINTGYNDSPSLAPQASTLSLDTGLRELGHSRESSSTTASSMSDLLDETGAAKSMSYDFTSAKLTSNDESESPSTASGMSTPKKAVSTPSLLPGATGSGYHNAPVTEWTPAHVCEWLKAINMGNYKMNFHEKQIDGQQLLVLDNARIKNLGITNSKERDTLKKRVKELKAAFEKDKKQREKEQKAREKLEKQAKKDKKKK